MKVLFLCTGNSARSQMAEGLLRWAGGSVVEVVSAGTHPTSVHPLAIQVMREAGVDISRQQSKPVEQFLDQPFDLVITLCDSANEACPVFSGAARRLHWSLPDPAAAGATDEQNVLAFRAVRDAIALQIDELLAEIVESFLNRMAAQADASHADALHHETA